MNSKIILIALVISWCPLSNLFCQEAVTIPVKMRVDVAKPLGPLRDIWRFFGADEPNYAYMRHGKKLIGELGEMKPQSVYFRAHSLLCSGDGTPALKWGSTG
ncbi:MAG: GH39 family glycosyl hydrolase, partial [Verrucomicrobiales bacterium]